MIIEIFLCATAFSPKIWALEKIRVHSLPISSLSSHQTQRSKSQHEIVGAKEVDVHAQARLARALETHACHLRSFGLGSIGDRGTGQRVVRHG